MDLSHNRLSGFIPTSLGSCVMLSSLHLRRNSLQGGIPDSLRALKGLEYLDLSQNNLSGMIPRFLVKFHLLYLSISFNGLQGNQDLCGGIAILNLPSCPSSPKSNKKGLGKILIPTIVGVTCLVALAVCFCVIIIYKRRTLQNVGIPTFHVSDFLRLSYANLLTATEGFSETNLLGAGRFGSVYKGIITEDDEQTDVAVKVLNLNVRGASKIVSSISQNLSSTEESNSSAIKGTIGDIPPEYGMSYVASTQGDVYSYGVLVLEIFTNRRPTSDAFEGYLNLQDFVCKALTERVMEAVDPFLHQKLNVDEKYWDCIVSILRIGVRCSKQLPRDRMSMAEVVNDLKKIRNVFPVHRNVSPYQH
ncbi:non-specific serine/threonine protein kinase [Salvia divinorum]|uniref:Non-specific serine/threonine protein kinase n=1 Tax=Salvia divinorum TaxID=28513 RepID=A0ABD1FPL8_SALDI